MTPSSDSIEARLRVIAEPDPPEQRDQAWDSLVSEFNALADRAREAERARDELREAVVEIEDMLDKMGCLSEGANCEIRRTDNPCPRCAALARLAAESTLKSSIGAVGR